MQQLFRAVGGAMLRVSAGDPRDWPAAPWPEGAAREDPAAWHEFVARAWASAGLARAVGQASPSLAATVREILSADGHADLKRTARAGMTLARYMVRLRGRATPFGMLAGVAPATTGDQAAAVWDTGHQLRARAEARWLTALVTALEADAQVLRGLRVMASDLLAVRGDRIIVGCLPQASKLAQDAPAEVSLRRTPAAEAALRLAAAPVTVADLASRIASEFPPATAGQAEAMISQLLACGALISALRPPSTATDGLTWILDALDTAGGQAVERDAALRDVRSRLASADPDSMEAIAASMRELADADAYPVAIDLRAGCHVTIPPRVADEAAAAASALARLSPHPRGGTGWNDFHARFLDRYGMGTAVPVAELLDPVAGLGLPSHYTATPPAGCTARDRVLATLAQQAALDGALEAVIDDAILEEVCPDRAGVRPVPHMDITVDVRAASIQAVTDGRFTVAVCGAGRTAMAASGRFLHLLTTSEREHLTRIYRNLPTVTSGALPAQLSFPPRQPRTENVTRVPLILPHLLSIGEHQQDGPGRIPLADLAVTASADQFFLVSLSRRMAVEPVLACAPAWRVVPPAVRLLFELPRARCAPAAVFDWGTASGMPFLPRLRSGQAILAPARWQVPAGSLPGPQAGHDQWTAALGRLRDRLRLPAWITAGTGDRQLRLNLDDPMDIAVLRAHLDTGGEPAVLTETWSPDAHAWCSGRAHEITIPLAAMTAPGPPPGLLARPGPLPTAGRVHGHLPGSGSVLSARVYSHPAVLDLIVTGCLPALTGGWDELGLLWFIRYRDPRHHLRLRLHAADPGQAAVRVGQWVEELRSRGLAADLVLDAYQPETGRFGAGPVLAAAEELFAADSAAALAQLTCAGILDPRALTAASLADLAATFLGGRPEGMRWLAANPLPVRPVPLDRDARRQALALVGGAPGSTLPDDVRLAWIARAPAARKYAGLLAESGRSPVGVLATLLHLHHNRVHGPGPEAEAVTYRLARACALRHAAAEVARRHALPPRRQPPSCPLRPTCSPDVSPRHRTNPKGGGTSRCPREPQAWRSSTGAEPSPARGPRAGTRMAGPGLRGRRRRRAGNGAVVRRARRRIRHGGRAPGHYARAGRHADIRHRRHDRGTPPDGPRTASSAAARPPLAEYDLVRGLAGTRRLLPAPRSGLRASGAGPAVPGPPHRARADGRRGRPWSARLVEQQRPEPHDQHPGRPREPRGRAQASPGGLSLLALAMRQGITVRARHPEAIDRICAWLDAWRQPGPAGPWWPTWITIAELREGRPTRPGPGRPSWCYGTPGIARALQLAAIARRDKARQARPRTPSPGASRTRPRQRS